MKRWLIMSLVGLFGLVAMSPAFANFGIKTTTDKIVMALTEPLDASGVPKKPDSVHVYTYLDNGTAATFFTRSTTYPFDAIGIDTAKNYGDTAYVFTETVSNIDGAGCNCQMEVWVTLWTAGLPTTTSASYQLTTQSFHTGFASLDAAVSSRLAPTVAARTLDVTTTGEAGLDLSNVNGTLDAAEIGSAALTAAKFAADVPKMIADTILGKDTTSHDYPSGSFGQLLETPSYVQGAAAGLDSAILSRVVGRKMWGIPAGSGSDSSSLSQRIIDSTSTKRIVSLGVYAIDSQLTIGSATYEDSGRTMGYFFAPQNMPSINQIVDSIWDEDSTGHYTSPNLAYTTAQGGSASVSNAQMGAIADSVWNKLFSSSFAAGSMGDSLNNPTWVRGVQHIIGNLFADSVWKVDTTGRGAPGKMGAAMNLASFASVNVLSAAVTDSLWQADTASSNNIVGSFGEALAKPSYVQGAAAGLDSAIVSRIVGRKTWGIVNGSATDITTLSQRTATVSAMDAGVITSAVIATDAIGAAELAADAIGSSEIGTDAIGEQELGPNSITNSELANDAIGSLEIADGAIDAGAIATDAIGSAEIATNAIDANEIAANTITNGTIADGTITNSKFGADAINAAVVAPSTIDASTFASGAITAAAIETDALGAAELAVSFINELAPILADSVWQADTLNHNNIVGSFGEIIAKPSYVQGAAAGVSDASVSAAVWNYAFNSAFTAGSMGDSLNNATYVQGAAAGLDSTKVSNILKRVVFGIPVGVGSDSVALSQRKIFVEAVANNAITAATLAPASITAEEIADGAFDNAALADNAITSAKIGTDAIGSDELAGDAIGPSEVAPDAIGSSELAGSAAKEIKDSVGTGSATSGAYTQTFTIRGITGIDTAGAPVLQGAKVSVNNVAQTGISDSRYSNTLGQVIFNLDAGTYAILLSIPGYVSEVDTIVVTTAASRTHYITKSTKFPRQPTVFADLRDPAGNAYAYAIIEFRIKAQDKTSVSPLRLTDSVRPVKYTSATDTTFIGLASFIDTADGSGRISADLYSNRYLTGPDTTRYQVTVKDRYGSKVPYWSDFTFWLDSTSTAKNLVVYR